MTKELNHYLSETGKIAEKCSSPVVSSLEGLKTGNESLVKSAENEIIALRMLTKMLTGEIVKQHAKFDSTKKEILIPMSVITQMERVFESCNDFFNALRIKIRHNVAFSDSATQEIAAMAAIASDSLNALGAALSTPSAASVAKVSEISASLSEKVRLSAEDHEKRLLDGVCKPESTYVFLDILYTLKAIGDHAAEATMKLSRTN